MDNEILNLDPEVNVYETGVTPEDVLKRSHNGMAPRKTYGVVPWKKDSEVYDPAELERIKITNNPPVLEVGDFMKLGVKQTPGLANMPDLCWESTNIRVAWVSQDGVVYATKEGQTEIKVGKPGSSVSSSLTVFVSSDGKIGPEKPEEIENTEEQQAIENNVIEQIEGGTTTINVEGTANNLTIPADTTKTITINSAFQDGATITNEGQKSITINNTGDPVSIVVDSPNASVTLKGSYTSVWSGTKTIYASTTTAHLDSVTFDSSLEGQGNLSVNANWNDPVEVISYNTNDLTISNASDNTVLEGCTVTAPRATVTMNGKWGNVEATVSNHSLILSKTFHCSNLKVNAGNVLVQSCFLESAYDSIELPNDSTVRAWTKHVPSETTNLTSTPGIFYIDSNININIIAYPISNGNYMYINNAKVTASSDNSIILTKAGCEQNVVVDGDGEWICENGYGFCNNSESGTITVKGGHIKASTSAIYCYTGTVIIEGGEFELINSSENNQYLLNCYDKNYTSGKAKIIVKGGRFHGFDPAHSTSEPGGEVNFVADGYMSVEVEPGIFEVTGPRQ